MNNIGLNIPEQPTVPPMPDGQKGRWLTDAEIKQYIDLAVAKSVEAYKKSGILNQSKSAAYNDASEILKSYFRDGKKDATVTYALQAQRFDPYFRIIRMYYEEGMTNEDIAGELEVDVSTVVRNKQRLCLLIYNELS